MIDIHAHILPGVDDGPSSMEESIQMGNLVGNMVVLKYGQKFQIKWACGLQSGY